jgi:hypothetical protein
MEMHVERGFKCDIHTILEVERGRLRFQTR